jgi:UDP-N-acetylglucosamine--N-acetylmuramyl-(pentapeptide) pyrophosphoryl-undecaprenol N-acetylglucosamine transferase
MTIVIAAGGTGGHLYPAIALAREFLRRDPTTRILFVGTKRGFEARVLAHEGFELALITAEPVMGQSPWRTLVGLAAVPLGLIDSLSLLRARRADLVVSVGGYTSPAMVTAAFLMRIPRVILEPNAYPGMANKVVGRLTQRVFLAFESAAAHFDARKVRVVGVPLRQAFSEEGEKSVARGERQPSAQDVGGGSVPAGHEPRASRLLIFGGSQGAKAINDAMVAALPELADMKATLSIVHQTGEKDHARIAAAYREAGMAAEVLPFIYDMPTALRSADLVVSRSGATTVAELAACGKPAILIPLPQAIYNHQMLNAEAMAKAEGAVVLAQRELTGARLAKTIISILTDPARLSEMSKRSRALRRTDSAEAIVNECYALTGRRHENGRAVGATGA